MHLSSLSTRRIVFAAVAGMVLASAALPGRAAIADKIATNAANSFVTEDQRRIVQRLRSHDVKDERQRRQSESDGREAQG